MKGENILCYYIINYTIPVSVLEQNKLEGL